MDLVAGCLFVATVRFAVVRGVLNPPRISNNHLVREKGVVVGEFLALGIGAGARRFGRYAGGDGGGALHSREVDLVRRRCYR